MCARSAYEPGFNYCMGLYKRYVVSKQTKWAGIYLIYVSIGGLIGWKGDLALAKKKIYDWCDEYIRRKMHVESLVTGKKNFFCVKLWLPVII